MPHDTYSTTGVWEAQHPAKNVPLLSMTAFLAVVLTAFVSAWQAMQQATLPHTTLGHRSCCCCCCCCCYAQEAGRSSPGLVQTCRAAPCIPALCSQRSAALCNATSHSVQGWGAGSRRADQSPQYKPKMQGMITQQCSIKRARHSLLLACVHTVWHVGKGQQTQAE
jgi:hypothetical protein